MNEAHLHMIINHFPIIIPFLALIIIACGFVVKSPLLLRVAYLLLIISGIFTFAAMWTGEGAEHIAEHLEGIDKDFIEVHEEHAELFALLSYALAFLALLALWSNWKKKSYAKYLSIAVVSVTLVTLYFAKTTGTSGGEIRHTEIRSEFSGNTFNDDHEKDDDNDDDH